MMTEEEQLFDIVGAINGYCVFRKECVVRSETWAFLEYVSKYIIRTKDNACGFVWRWQDGEMIAVGPYTPVAFWAKIHE